MNQTTVKSKKQKSWGDKLRNWVETIGTIPNRLTKKRKPNRLHECFSRDEVSCLREAVPNYYTTRLASEIRQWKFMGFEPNPDLTNCDYPARCLTENSQDSTSKATSFALIITPIAIVLLVLLRCCKRRQANLEANRQPLILNGSPNGGGDGSNITTTQTTNTTTPEHSSGLGVNSLSHANTPQTFDFATSITSTTQDGYQSESESSSASTSRQSSPGNNLTPGEEGW